MDNERVAELVEEALERAPAERAKFLEEACGSDHELRMKVESLLGYEEKARNFIERPAYAQAPESLLEATHKLIPGQLLGNHRILSLLGEGGMGEVYLAEDTTLKRRVAIKLIKGSFGSVNIVRHFHNEERILAELTHPNIARLYGGGVTADGIPYFIMELVEGDRIDDYCRSNKLSLKQRLELFRKVCGAVAYAHQHLVIHRDLKPANIRVTAEGEPKLLDFGIAKLLDPETSSVAEQTMTLQAIMTPDYASPEQVRGEVMTTASDVYSLGVILFELLTGARPFRIRSRRPEEIARTITEQEPARPSTVLAKDRQSGDAESIYPRLLRGDLDNITLKALREEPDRRYSSAGQISEDIRRYLEGQPIVARRDTLSYRTSKFVARNRLAVSAAAIVILAITAGLVVAIWEAKSARTQRDLAQREEAKAQRINEFLQQMLSFSNHSLTSVAPLAQKKEVTVNEMLDEVAPRAEMELAAQPDVRAQILRTIGSGYASQGQYARAEKSLRAALEAQDKLYGKENPESAATMVELGGVEYRQLKFAEARPLLQKAIAFYRSHRLKPEYDPAKLAVGLQLLGDVTGNSGDTKGCLELLKEAVAVSSAANLEGKDRALPLLMKADLGAASIEFGDADKGEELLQGAMDQLHQISKEETWEFGIFHTMLGVAAAKKNKLEDAREQLNRGEQILRQTIGDSNGYFLYNLNQSSGLLLALNDFKGAEEKARHGITVAQAVVPGNSQALAPLIWILAESLNKTGRFAEAEHSYRQLLPIYEAQTTKNYSYICTIKVHLSQALLAENRLLDAESAAIEAYNDAQKLNESDPTRKVAADNLIGIYQKEGKEEAAQAIK